MLFAAGLWKVHVPPPCFCVVGPSCQSVPRDANEAIRRRSFLSVRPTRRERSYFGRTFATDGRYQTSRREYP